MQESNLLPYGFHQFGFWLLLGIGLAVGSFLNVVIHRMPKALFASDDENTATSPFACLLSPGSTTPCCQKAIAWKDNVPVFSWLWLRARCRYCSQAISPRYILVELLTGLGFAWSYLHFGQSVPMVFYCLLFTLLMALFWIDLETYYLPDYFTYSVLWLGLIGSALGYLPLSPTDAILGSSVGYFLPWSVNFVYRLWRKRDGFGGGDFKLLAARGAWLGVVAIIPLLMLASIVALVGIGLLMLLRKEKPSLERMLPFGPFLILAGVLILVCGIPMQFIQ